MRCCKQEPPALCPVASTTIVPYLSACLQIVSGLRREIPSPAGQVIPGAIQTDAAINSGEARKGQSRVLPVELATGLHGTGVAC